MMVLQTSSSIFLIRLGFLNLPDLTRLVKFKSEQLSKRTSVAD